MIMTEGFTGRFNAVITQFTVELQPRIISQMFDSSALCRTTNGRDSTQAECDIESETGVRCSRGSGCCDITESLQLTQVRLCTPACVSWTLLKASLSDGSDKFRKAMFKFE